jgi:gas vesicle protein
MAEKKNSLLGITTALIGATAAGFFLYGPKGAENRQKIKGWTLKAKGEVLEKIEDAKELTDESYEAIVDTVTARYAKLKKVGEEEANKLNKELKRHWKTIKKVASEESTKKKPAPKKAKPASE